MSHAGVDMCTKCESICDAQKVLNVDNCFVTTAIIMAVYEWATQHKIFKQMTV